jgi:BON domain
MRRVRLFSPVLLSALALAFWACNVAHVGQKTPGPDDTAITTAVQAKLFEDPTLKAREIRVISQNGIVTLSGTVESNVERLAVERLAHQASGVTQVIDQLVVTAPPAAQAPPTAPPVQQARSAQHRIEPARRRENVAATHAAKPLTNDVAVSAARSPASTPPKPAEVVRVTPPPPPPPPPVTVPAGMVVRVQMIDSIDSKHNHPGDEFAATLAAPVVAGPKVVFPQGADARVRLVEAQQSGRFRGSSALELELVSLAANGTTYKVESGYYNVHGESRGKRTGETVGGGAGLGALIGAIAGRGKGAAIGAGIGAAAGGGIQALGRGPQSKIPSETKIDFTLKTPITVAVKQ